MSHIHIPDGVLPFWLWSAGFALTAAMLAIALWRLRGMDSTRKVPLLGVMAAMMVVSMSIEIVPIAYHINLSVIAGALLGPALGFVCAFIVEVILALLGHGGVTVVGLNTLMIGSEVAVGWLLFRAFSRIAGRARVKYGVGIATVLTLAVTTTMAVAIVGISGINPRQALESGVLDPSTLRLENPFGKHAEEAPAEEAVPGESLPGESLSLRRFATVVYILAVPGWLFEALLTSLMIGFIAKVRPDLLGLGPPHVPLGEPVTDYGRH